MNTPVIPIATRLLVDAFDYLEIKYFIGGSLASSVYGLPRSTIDVDFVADIQKPNVQPLVSRLVNKFYVDEDMILEAINQKSSFNIIHLETLIKLDVFILKSTSYDQLAFTRAQEISLDLEQEIQKFKFALPEDIVLHKLLWYEMGGQVSERQWNDVLGVLKVQGCALDQEYMKRWAKELQVSTLLDLAFETAGL